MPFPEGGIRVGFKLKGCRCNIFKFFRVLISLQNPRAWVLWSLHPTAVSLWAGETVICKEKTSSDKRQFNETIICEERYSCIYYLRFLMLIHDYNRQDDLNPFLVLVEAYFHLFSSVITNKIITHLYFEQVV